VSFDLRHAINQNRTDLVKDRLQIVIFGAYRPDEAFTRLNSFKEFLQNNGFPGARLVADLDTPEKIDGETDPEYILRKCRFWMEHADAVFFTFFNEARIEGVSSEFTFFIDLLFDRIWHAVVFSEPNDLSMMIQGNIDLWKPDLKQTSFSGDDDLYKFALGYLVDFPKRLFYKIRDRPPFTAI